MAKTLGSLIAAYRKKKNMSLKDFAEASGISKPYIAVLEKDVRPDTGKAPAPSLDIVVAAARAMDMDTLELMREIGIDISKKEDEQDAKTNRHITQDSAQSRIKPFQHIPLTQENLNAAIRERRVLLLPFRVPRRNDLVYVPMHEYGMPVAHTITKVDGGVYEAFAEVNGKITFTLFDIGVRVFNDYGSAAEKIKKQPFE